MATLSFDRHDLIEHLTSGGISSEHAKAIANGLKEVSLQHVTTQADLLNLKHELTERITKLEGELKTQISQSGERLVKWFVPMMLAQVGAIAALVKLL